MSRLLHAALIMSVLLVIGFRVYWHFATEESQPRSMGTLLESNDISQWRDAAGRAYAIEDWAVTIEACQKILEQEPDNGQAWARISYAQHQLGQYDQAIAGFLRVCQTEGRPRQWALYYIAAAYARLHEKQPADDNRQMALDYLQDAVETGYRRRSDEVPVAEDPDFRSIATDPEFQRLAELTKPIFQRSVYRQFDALLDNWILQSGDGRRIGQAKFTAESGGYAIVGQINDNTRATASTVFAFYDPATSQWRMAWLDDHGNVSQLASQASDDESLRLEGDMTTADGRRLTARVVFDETAEGTLHVSMMCSSDGGNRWTELLDALLVPARPRQRQ